MKVKTKARNLGVIMDRTLSFSDHINETYKKVSSAIRSIERIRKYLPHYRLKWLVNSLVIPRVDYCNSLLFGIPNYQKAKLQRIQNVASSVGNRYTHHAPTT